jgi:hypothetical protein
MTRKSFGAVALISFRLPALLGTPWQANAQKFQRDETMEANVLCFVNDAHASAAEAFHDAIVRVGLVEERIVAGHVLDILGCGKRQVHEDAAIACKRRRATPRHTSRNATSLDARRP